MKQSAFSLGEQFCAGVCFSQLTRYVLYIAAHNELAKIKPCIPQGSVLGILVIRLREFLWWWLWWWWWLHKTRVCSTISKSNSIRVDDARKSDASSTTVPTRAIGKLITAGYITRCRDFPRACLIRTENYKKLLFVYHVEIPPLYSAHPWWWLAVLARFVRSPWIMSLISI